MWPCIGRRRPDGSQTFGPHRTAHCHWVLHPAADGIKAMFFSGNDSSTTLSRGQKCLKLAWKTGRLHPFCMMTEEGWHCLPQHSIASSDFWTDLGWCILMTKRKVHNTCHWVLSNAEYIFVYKCLHPHDTCGPLINECNMICCICSQSYTFNPLQ